MASSTVATIAEAGRDALGSLGSEEMTSVKKNAALNMLIFSKDRIGGLLTSASDFDLVDLHRKVMTVYVMIPEDALTVYTPLLRLLVGSATVAMVRGKHLPRPKHKPLFLIDELTAEQRRDLLLGFVREQFISRGMVADVCFHDPVPERGDSRENFHCHVMLTLRKATKTGLLHTKTREWNSDKLLRQWRETWCNQQNEALARHGHRDRVDHRTLEAQRADAQKRGDRAAELALDRTPEIHIGAKANKLARQGKMLRSREREAGPRRSKHGGKPHRRTVRYTSIDQGSRLAHNLRIVMGNIERLNRHVKHYQRLSALFRYRRQWMDRAEFEQTLADKRKQSERKWQKARDQAAVVRAMTSPSPKAKHRNKRKRLADFLIGDIERALAGLLGVRERSLSRRAHLGRKHGNSLSLFRPKRRSRSLFGELHR